MPTDVPDFDLTDDELQASDAAKWSYPAPGVLPAWVAELDVRPAPAVAAALHDAIDRGALGYPGSDAHSGLPQALSTFAAEHWNWSVPPEWVLVTADVMAGIQLALNTRCEPAPVIVPTPSYPPFLATPQLTGRQVVTVDMIADAGGVLRLDLDGIDRLLAAGARTVLLANPHNPSGRCFGPEELAGLRDVVLRHRGRVISDEIHAPLVLPGARHTPYATLEGTAGQVITVLAASKAWNLAGLKCAQLVAGSAEDQAAFEALPLVANHGVSSLGVVASLAAYTQGDAWLAGLLTHLDARRDQFGKLLAEHLPELSWQPMEGTYLAWLDAGPTGLTNPTGTALAKGRVFVSAGHAFALPGEHRYDQHVRINLGTSGERLERVVRRLATAWSG